MPTCARLLLPSRRLVALPDRVLPEASSAYMLPLLARLVATSLEVVVKTNMLTSWVPRNAALIQQLARHTFELLLLLLALAFAPAFLVRIVLVVGDGPLLGIWAATPFASPPERKRHQSKTDLIGLESWEQRRIQR